jgi:bis(5'-nucleosyl)-tetraphosphatase (symmetrical)
MSYGTAVRCVLGNHDLHLLAAAHGARKPSRKDTLNGVLNAGDRAAMLDWLRQQPMALLQRHQGMDYLLVHAGVLPAWSATKTMALALEVETVLRGPDLPEFLHQMYGNAPTGWHDGLAGIDRLRVIVNALTRLRFCTLTGEMEFSVSDGPGAAPPGYLHWFDVPGRPSADVCVAFGHWSTLGWLGITDVLSLDTGCVWGGCLSALKLRQDERDTTHELIQVQCPQAQKPGT